jgi:hypothetical protein
MSPTTDQADRLAFKKIFSSLLLKILNYSVVVIAYSKAQLKKLISHAIMG